MFKKNLLAAAIAVAVTVSGTAVADHKGGFVFKPIDESANAADWDATAPWKLPRGYIQTVVSDETNLNIYDGGRDDWNDMNTVNASYDTAGRYFYARTIFRF